MSSKLIVCSACRCHARSTEIDCPHCGERLRAEGGAQLRSAAAILLGLSIASAAAEGCTPSPAYGGPPVDASNGAAASGTEGGQDAGTD
ncbi:hypothetical protein [Polyangium sp. 6x1]|uniref:hypothetical protein n=1 Tax=Polyangium sp. 6x1 TaxID=3042689 RepID=UPI002482EB36|nr:hypothetical protein [Polyangium sp. 6x1]MDI1448883.1 hypothetical protein [Polyangium sp. 6x1]